MKDISCSVLVIGGGLAGILVAHRASGYVLLATRGLGATALCPAVFRREPDDFAGFAELAETCGVEYAGGTVATGDGDVVKAQAPSWCLLEDAEPYFVGLSGLPDTGWTPNAAIDIDWGVPLPTFAGAAARVESVPDVRDALVRGLAEVSAETLLLPPVLGITPQTRLYIERESGCRLVELACPQGALGKRLLHALWRGLFEKENVDVIEEARVVKLEAGPPHRVSFSLGNLGRRVVDVVSERVALCTGGPLTALEHIGDELVEPLTSKGCARLSDTHVDLLSPQPAFDACLPVDDNYRVRGFKGVFAAGAVGAGFGLDKCVDSAWEVSRWL